MVMLQFAGLFGVRVYSDRRIFPTPAQGTQDAVCFGDGLIIDGPDITVHISREIEVKHFCGCIGECGFDG